MDGEKIHMRKGSADSRILNENAKAVGKDDWINNFLLDFFFNKKNCQHKHLEIVNLVLYFNLIGFFLSFLLIFFQWHK